jgi:hypothetical protein
MNKRRWMGLALGMMLATGGCFPMCGPGSVNGEIDGEALPGMSSGLWYLAYDAELFRDYVFLMMSIPNACEVVTAQLKANTEATKLISDASISGDPDEITKARADAAALMDAWWDEFIKNDDFWSFQVNAAAKKVGDLADKTLDLTEAGFVSDEGDAAVAAFHQMGKPDFKKFYDDSDVGALKGANFFHKSGKLEMGSAEEDGPVSGSGTAKMVKPDPDDYTKQDDAGEVTFDFNVQHCPEAEEAAKDQF